MFFQDFLGGRTLNTIPSEKGSRLSTSSSSASPPSLRQLVPTKTNKIKNKKNCLVEEEIFDLNFI